MARVSIEDCLEFMENRFALVAVAADRARQLMAGQVPSVRTKNKEGVTALREIADGNIESDRPVQNTVGEDWEAICAQYDPRLKDLRLKDLRLKDLRLKDPKQKKLPQGGGFFLFRGHRRWTKDHKRQAPFGDHVFVDKRFVKPELFLKLIKDLSRDVFGNKFQHDFPHLHIVPNEIRTGWQGYVFLCHAENISPGILGYPDFDKVIKSGPIALHVLALLTLFK